MSPFLSRICAAAATSAGSSETSTPCGFEPSCIDRETKGHSVSNFYGVSYDLCNIDTQQETVVREVMQGFVTVECCTVLPKAHPNSRKYFWQSFVTLSLIFGNVMKRSFHMTPSRTKLTMWCKKHGQVKESDIWKVYCYKKLFSLTILRKRKWHHWTVSDEEETKKEHLLPSEVIQGLLRCNGLRQFCFRFSLSFLFKPLFLFLFQDLF